MVEASVRYEEVSEGEEFVQVGLSDEFAVYMTIVAVQNQNTRASRRFFSCLQLETMT